MKNALIIFVKNLQLGKVKTRLAAAFGPEEALAIYTRLLQHTQKLVEPLLVEKHLFYSQFIEEQGWPNHYLQHVQQGADLGARMAWAFEKVFRAGAKNTVIIGSDCLELTPHILNEAFDQLASYDVVLGPAKDGGYYLLGMTQLHVPLFENIQWSTSVVLKQTIAACNRLELKVKLLPLLSDIDEPADWIQAKNQQR